MDNEKSKKILLIEDNKDIADVLMRRLQMKDYEVKRLANGFEVLAMMAKEEEPEAVILDLMIPGRSGFDLLNSIKIKWNNTKLFVFSGYSNYETSIPPELIEGFFLKTDGFDRLIQALKKSLKPRTLSTS